MNTSSTLYSVDSTSLCSTCVPPSRTRLPLLPIDVIVIAAASCTALWLWLTRRPDTIKLDQHNRQSLGHVFRAKTVHARYLPVESRHQFSYPVLFFGLDLDALEHHHLDLDSRVFQYGTRSKGSRWQVCSIEPDVYFDPPTRDEEVKARQGIKQKLRKHLVKSIGSTEEVDRSTESVYTVTMPKYLGFQDINPLTVHFCYSGKGSVGKRMAVVALEVSNTFGEKHLYTLKVGQDEDEKVGKGYDYSWTFPRAFHVSPFNDRSGFYQVSVVDPLKHVYDGTSHQPRLDVKVVTLTSDRQKKLFASLVGDGLPLTKSTVLGSVTRWPMSLLLTTPRILYQAAILHYRKWLDVFPRPEPFVAIETATSDEVNPVEASHEAKQGGVQWQDEGAFTTFARQRTVAFLERRVDEMGVRGRPVKIVLRPANINIDPVTIASTSIVEQFGLVETLEMAYLTPLMFDDLFLCPTPRLALELGSRTEHRWFVNNEQLFLNMFDIGAAAKVDENVLKMRRLRADVVKWGLSFHKDDPVTIPSDIVKARDQPLAHPFDDDAESSCARALSLATSQFRFVKIGYWAFVLFRASSMTPSSRPDTASKQPRADVQQTLTSLNTDSGPVALLPPVQDALHTFKVVVIGDAGTGKTSLRTRYTHNTFSSSYRATIGCDFVSKTVFVDDMHKVVLSVWDTAGQERFKSLAASFYRGADACILVYSDETSLTSVEGWFNEFRTRCPVDDLDVADFAWVAVGAKADLWREKGFEPQEERVARILDELAPRTSRQGHGGLSANGHALTHHNDDRPSSPEPLHCHRGADAIDQTHVTPSKLRVKTRTRECCGHEGKLKNKRSTVSMTNSVYHTPSSTMRGAPPPHASTESLLSEDTVMPGTPSTTASVLSERDVFQWTDNNEEHFAAEQAKERARGVDVFMATSPPHTPRSLLQRDRTTYKGGPSVFHAEDEPKAKGADGKSENRTTTSAATGGGAGGSGFTATESAYSSCISSSTAAGHDFAQDGVKHFVTSAKTGQGVEQVFDYLARRLIWKREKDEREQKARAEAGEKINLLPDKKKRNKWVEACCA
ncbi:hypothetical protein ACM66B_004436 [Microbotryomycetes sp. NB124-2]